MTIIIHGTPKAQPRVKAYRRGSHVGVYTPKSSATSMCASIARQVDVQTALKTICQAT